MNTYTLDDGGRVVEATQTAVDIDQLQSEIASMDARTANEVILRAALVQKLVDIADQIPEKATEINAIPAVSDFRAVAISRAQVDTQPVQSQV